MDKEINRRISAAWSKFQSLRHILKDNFKLYHKDEIYDICALPTLTYGCQDMDPYEKTFNKNKSYRKFIVKVYIGGQKIRQNQNRIIKKPNSPSQKCNSSLQEPKMQ